ncbi:MAG: M20 family metallopeptidase [Alphaproteobacteria bacterium]
MLDPIKLTQDFICQNTCNPPGNEKIIADSICALFEPLDIEIQEHIFDDNRSGLLLKITGEKSQEGSPLPLTFTGHFDTVPLGEVPWEHEPLSAEIIDGKIYGRGSSDMKSGVAAFLAAIYNNIDVIKQGYGCICILTACEELACQGAKKMAADGILPKAIGPLIIAEPTGNQIRIGHKGVFWTELTFNGKAAHGSMPHEGSSAIEAAIKFIETLKKDLKAVAYHHPDFGEATLNIGEIKGGTAINLVADQCKLKLDIRLTPSTSSQDMIELFDELLKHYDASYEILDAGDSVYTPETNEFVQLVSHVAKKVGADEEVHLPLTFFTDGSPILKACSSPAAIIYGPGETAMCHKVNEFAYIQKIKQAYEVYSQIIKDYNQ